MTRTERIKEALARHTIDEFELHISPEAELKRFLLDKSLTGARMAHLCEGWGRSIQVKDRRHGDWPHDEKSREYVGAELILDHGRSSIYAEGIELTHDSAIAALWLKVFIDTEESE